MTGDAHLIKEADKIILPGVGAFADAAEKLRQTGLDEVLKQQVEQGKIMMGICLGMQLLFDESFEYGRHAGLGLIPGKVKTIEEVIGTDLKIPHMGWNALDLKQKHPLFAYINQGDCVYFVHSYHATDCQDHIIASTEYGASLTAAVARNNVLGCQFHPEKSGEAGLNILRAFCEIREEDLC